MLGWSILALALMFSIWGVVGLFQSVFDSPAGNSIVAPSSILSVQSNSGSQTLPGAGNSAGSSRSPSRTINNTTDTTIPNQNNNNSAYPWPTGDVVENGITCNGGKKIRPINISACFDNYKSYINSSASKYGIDKNTIRAVIWQESQGNSNATSRSRALGLMQIMPDTASSISCISGWETGPEKNIDCGTKYLKNGLTKVSNNFDLYAGYNGGYRSDAIGLSNDCPGLKKWQCAFDNSAHSICNTGFLESRNYAIEIDTWKKTLDDNTLGCSW
jgi:hypothetical protein